jgi:hypothetical protein
MANNKIQHKRTSVSGRTANVTNSGNTQYIAAGELALNMADGILYSSNGSSIISIGANQVNQSVTGTLTVNAISSNGTTGSNGQVLTSNGSGTYWSSTGGGGSGTVTSVATGNGMTGGPITNTGTVSVLSNTGIVANATGVFVNSAYIATIAANNASFLGGTAAASYQTTAGLSANVATLTSNNSTFSYGKTEGALNVNSALTANNSTNLGGTAASGYQTTAGLSANVATLTSNNTSFVGSVSAANVVSNAQLSSNLLNYQTTAGLSANVLTLTSNNSTFSYGKTEGSLNVNSALTANNSTNLGGTAAAGYQTTAGLSANVAALTSNNATNAFGKTEGNLNVNNALTSNNATNLGGVAASGYQTTAGLSSNVATLTSNNTSFVGSVSAANVVSNAQLSSNLANYAALSGAAFTGAVSVSNTFTVTGNLVVTGTTFSANVTNLDVTDKNITVAKGSATAAAADGAGLTVDTANVGWYYHNASNTWQSNVGITPSANVTFNLGTTTLNWANVHANNIVGVNVFGTIQTTSQPNITANNTTNAFGKTEGNLNVNNATTAYGKTEIALNVNSALTSNNSTNLGGQAAAFYTNATNITTGTLPYAQIPANVINTTAAFTRTGITTFSANVVLGSSGLSSNGGFGTAGHVLHTNGTSTYWAADDNSGGTVTSVATGNGMTGGTITATGTVSVLANNGLSANATGVYVVPGNGLVTSNSTGVHVGAGSGVTINSTAVAVNPNTGIVANATGVYVNAVYINTISSNSATFANSSVTNTFTVGTASYFVANGNLGVGTTTPGYKLQVAGDVSISGNTFTNSNFYSQTTTNKTLSVSFSGSNTLTLDIASSNFFNITLDRNVISITLTNVPNNVVTFFITSFDIQGTYTVTWPIGFKWREGVPPTLSNTVNDVHTFIFYTTDGGVNVNGFDAGYNR